MLVEPLADTTILRQVSADASGAAASEAVAAAMSRSRLPFDIVDPPFRFAVLVFNPGRPLCGVDLRQRGGDGGPQVVLFR
ncbi:hypothetical protein DB459_06190 [Bradyrhizobium sp. WD16]|nr:hypothetical protein DB459_06190 [Bradyrhizobium sp. WD16]